MSSEQKALVIRQKIIIFQDSKLAAETCSRIQVRYIDFLLF